MPTQNPTDILRHLILAGAEIWADGDKLRARGPKGLMTAEVMASLRTHKDAILRSLPELVFTIPLSPGQEALWLIQHGDPDCAAYNIALTLRVESRSDPRPLLKQALQRLVNRHLVLRATYPMVDGRPRQQIRAAAEVVLHEQAVDVSTPEALHESLAQLNLRPFNLACETPLRCDLVEVGGGEYVLALCFHHIAADGWSMRMFVDELVEVLRAGRRAALQPIRHTYKRFIDEQRQMLAEHGEGLRRYWFDALDAAPRVLELPSDRQRPARQTFGGGVHLVTLAPTLAKDLRAVARRGKTTLYTALLAASQVLLHRLSGQEDLCVGSPTAGRSEGYADTFGYLVNPIVVRSTISLDAPPTFLALLEQTRQRVLAGLEHESLPFAWLAKELLRERDASRSPLFQVMVVYQREQEATGDAHELLDNGVIEASGLRLSKIDVPQRACEMDLVIEISERDSGVEVAFRYNSD
ncbi:MAG: condensation domain-containing protein, partial [Nannocystaceae bacterium]